jgi:hypothetical protein
MSELEYWSPELGLESGWMYPPNRDGTSLTSTNSMGTYNVSGSPCYRGYIYGFFEGKCVRKAFAHRDKLEQIWAYADILYRDYFGHLPNSKAQDTLCKFICDVKGTQHSLPFSHPFKVLDEVDEVVVAVSKLRDKTIKNSIIGTLAKIKEIRKEIKFLDEMAMTQLLGEITTQTKK